MGCRAVLVLLILPSVGLWGADSVEFNRDVRPILSDKCFTCHGPDAAAKKVPFRLDHEDAAKADLGGGRHAIVEGDPQASELVQRITAASPARRMPPVYSGLKLTEAEITTLRNWIAQGAKWEKHWSFIPPRRPPLPKVADGAWPRNPIDSFVLQRLEREGLKPSPEADRATLLRRVTLDLTGLPPTPAEIDTFLRDRSPDAYSKVVDRLLASPRYGERMAEPWLDAARYADTNGYQYDGVRDMWRWRDWVIRAFNRNEPFDQFTVDQIAGDLLPHATLDQQIATGFNRNHRINTEDGIIAEEYAVEYVVDRVETTSAVFLGLTLGCARCHNHKYDPFSQKEFYQVYAYFNNVPELGRGMKYGNSPPVIPAPTAAQQHDLARIDDEEHSLRDFLARHAGEVQRAERGLAGSLQHAEPVFWSPSVGLDRDFALDGNDPALKSQDGAVGYASGRIGQAARFEGKAFFDAGSAGDFDIEDRFAISAWVKPEAAASGAIATRMRDEPKGRGYGIYLDQGKVYVHITSNWADDAIRLETEETIPAGSWHHVAVTYAGTRLASGIRVYIDGRTAKTKVLLDMLYRPFRNAGRVFKEPFRIGGGGGPERRFHGSIDEVRIYGRVLADQEIASLALGESVSAIAAKPPAERSEAEKLTLRWYYLDQASAGKLHEAWQRLGQLALAREKLERTFPTVMVMAEQPVRKDTFLLIRGAYDRHGEKVQPGVPAVLPPLPPGAPNNRLGFAKWLVDPANPLTARVAVNRFWQMYFGTGLVKTVEDFGSQGEWPSHPALLDWLATEFIRTGWDVKAMQKLIVTSATYRQSSKPMPELVQRDPENRLLARGPRFRLPAEMLRDQALFVSGLLKERTGGPSVMPYQPAGLWNELAMQDMDYVQSKGDDLYRRSLYTFWKRTIAPPMMVNFDAANRESCVVRTTRTNTPLQALNLMNDVTFVEAGRFLGQRMLKEGGARAESRLRYGFRLATGREPSASELEVLLRNLQFHRNYFRSQPARVKDFLSHGDSPSDSTLDLEELAAYGEVGSLLLNLDETITKE